MAFRGRLDLTGVVAVLPVNGDSAYYRCFDRMSAQWYFIKSVLDDAGGVYRHLVLLEKKISEHCDCVLSPILATATEKGLSQRLYIATRYYPSEGPTALTPILARRAGFQLSILHNTLKELEGIIGHSRGRAYTLELRRFLMEELLVSSVAFPGIDIANLIVDENREYLIRLQESDFFDSAAQPVHGDLNLGNVICSPKEKAIYFIDFEEVLTSCLPVGFDLAFFLERNVLHVARSHESARVLASEFLSGYVDSTGNSPAEKAPELYVNALTYSLLRSLYVLVNRIRGGAFVPGSEWAKLVDLRKTRQCYESLLLDLGRLS